MMISARRMLFVLAILLLSAVATSVSAQDNLLANPSFEPPFDPVEGVVPGQIAQGWMPWHLTTDGALQPEYYPATDVISGMGTPRINSGVEAQQYFTFFSAHVAGVYQHVTGVTAGDTLEFSIYAWLWSSSGEDTSVSAEDASMTIEVGIDPTGGEDASSSAVVWSEPSSTFDQFVQLTVTSTAESDTVTVFVRSSVNAVLMNNVVYLDDASLTVIAPAEAVEETAEATEDAIATEPATEEATEVAVETTVEVTEVVVETETPIVIEVTEAATSEPTLEATTEAALEATPEETVEVTPEVTLEVTVEVTAEASPTSTETPTEVPTEATPEVTEEPSLVPTETPTVVEPTATFTSSPIPTLPVETPTLVPTEVIPTLVPPTPTPSPTLNLTVFPFAIPYTVESGDFVAAIAERFNTTAEAIIIANGLNEDAFISVGQQLIIPVASLPQPTVPPTSTPQPQAVVVEPTFTPTAVQVIEVTATSIVEVQVVPPTATQVTTRYIVQYGDTLSSIAGRFRVSARELARVNRIVNPNLVYVGQVLLIPTAGSPTPTSIAPTATSGVPTPVPPTQIPAYRVYRVMPGDTLYLISIRLNVRISDLVRLNRIVDANRIFVGQLLYIP